MSSPYEILAGPATVWVAAANTAETQIDTAPSGSWTKLGANGADNYDEDGVMIGHDQTLEQFRGLGKTGNLKTWRTEEDVRLEFTLYDITMEQYRKAINDNAITTVAAGVGVPGSKRISNAQGLDVALFAVLARVSYSPYNDGLNFQVWLPVAYNASSPELVYKKGEPAGLKFEFKAIQDQTNGLGVVRAQTAAAS